MYMKNRASSLLLKEEVNPSFLTKIIFCSLEKKGAFFTLLLCFMVVSLLPPNLYMGLHLLTVHGCKFEVFS